MRRALAMACLVGALAVVPVVALAQGGQVSGLLVRLQGDVVVGGGESADLVLVVNGDAEVRGRAAVVVVVGGTARLIGARVGHLAVVRGKADLQPGTVVEGDVWLAFAQLSRSGDAAVEGAVRPGVAHYGWGWLAVSPLLSVGLAVLVVACGLLLVATGPRRLRTAAAALTAHFGGSLAWAVVMFAAVPALAALAYFTVVGLPLALVVLGLLLPVAFLVGFSVSGLRLGTWLLRSRAARPYWAAAVGSLVLLAVGLVPVAGQILVAVAAALGAGAVVTTVIGGAEAPVAADGEPGPGEAGSVGEAAVAGEAAAAGPEVAGDSEEAGGS